jgi:hypothetical protein
VILDDGRLRASAQLRGQSVTVVERDAGTAAAQRRRKEELQLDHVTIVHADVFAWLETADVAGAWVWLDVEASTVPAAAMRHLSATAAGAVTLAARSSQTIKRRVSTLRACFPRFRALDGYQRPGGMVMYTLSWGRRPVADADFDYHVRQVRLFRGRTGAKAVEIQWWGYPSEADRYAYYVSRRVSVHVEGSLATVTLPNSRFAAPAVGGW